MEKGSENGVPVSECTVLYCVPVHQGHCPDLSTNDFSRIIDERESQGVSLDAELFRIVTLLSH